MHMWKLCHRQAGRKHRHSTREFSDGSLREPNIPDLITNAFFWWLIKSMFVRPNNVLLKAVLWCNILHTPRWFKRTFQVTSVTPRGMRNRDNIFFLQTIVSRQVSAWRMHTQDRKSWGKKKHSLFSWSQITKYKKPSFGKTNETTKSTRTLIRSLKTTEVFSEKIVKFIVGVHELSLDRKPYPHHLYAGNRCCDPPVHYTR